MGFPADLWSVVNSVNPRAVVRRLYGEGPLHLLLMAASFALAGYAGVRLLAGDAFGVVVWFIGAALVHDLVLVPVYASADRLLCRSVGRRSGLVNFVRVPVLLSGLLLLVWFPLITRRAERYEPASGLSPDVFLGNWLLTTAALFLVSGLCLVVWTVRLRRREMKERPSASH
ncbi:hypothetical protein [Streptomyces sp. NPDC050422]|uniref:hypothetical protein n=1 Tax=Streptomyces sp. NPDC050422 TaxID=3365614 RepID=UPI003796B221